MKKILIVPVNYNSYDYLDSYMKSISEAWENAKNDCELTVYIADNSTKPEDFDITRYGLPDVRIKHLDNLGYFGGALYVINNCVNVDDYDYVIISNVDMTFDKTAIFYLSKSQIQSDVGWISPHRYSEKYHKTLYVEKKNRPSKFRIWSQSQVFRSKWLYEFQRRIVSKRYHTAKDIEHPKSIIYMGCGSCFILTKTFFQTYRNISYPIFLYGEELFIAELCRNAKLKVLYDPSIKITNVGAISTGELATTTFLKYNHEAVQYIYERFFKG